VSPGLPDYPRNQAEFEIPFATEDAWPRLARAAALARRLPLSTVRANEGLAGRLWHCAACGRQTSVTAGTIFQDTRTPLTVWFRAMWAVTGPKTGTSALALQRLLGLGSYQTA